MFASDGIDRKKIGIIISNNLQVEKGCHAMTNATLRGKPDAGNPHVRFDEGEVASAKPRRGSLLYNTHARRTLAAALIALGLAAAPARADWFYNTAANYITNLASGASITVSKYATDGTNALKATALRSKASDNAYDFSQ